MEPQGAERRLADFTGDAFLAEFPTALDAVACALETQRVLAARNAALPPERRLEFRMGIHLGDVRAEGERLFGNGVNVAARLQTLAEPGGLCTSDAVRQEVAAKLALELDDPALLWPSQSISTTTEAAERLPRPWCTASTLLPSGSSTKVP